MREEDIVCVGSDGLQYCKVCGEAKEAFFPEGGFMGMKNILGNVPVTEKNMKKNKNILMTKSTGN